MSLNPIWAKDPKVRAQLLAGMVTDRRPRPLTDEDRKELADHALVEKANDLALAGRLAEARAIYERVLGDNEGLAVSGRAVAGLANVALKSGDNAAALEYYRELMTVKAGQNWVGGNTSDPAVRMKYALLLRDAGFADEAWEYYRMAAAGSSGSGLPEPPPLRREQVQTPMFAFTAALFVAGRMASFDQDQAVTYARLAVKANPTGGLGHYCLGKLLMDSEEHGAEAKNEFEKAARYGHGDYARSADSYLHYWKMNGSFKPRVETVPAPEKTKPD